MIYIKIVVDAFGGDFAPPSVIKGSVIIKEQFPNLDIVFSGNEKKLKQIAKNIDVNISDFEILNAKDYISPEEDPSKILKEKSDSSMAIGLKALNEDYVDAFLTAGSTGALAVGACFFNKKIKGIKRAALCTTVPAYGGKFLLVDAGANLQCRENVLFEFAIMGEIYAKKILKINNPRIGLANVGAEPKKGTTAHQAAFEMLKNYERLNFIGNVEARYIPLGVCDVVVSDGLSGNMILKTMEGTAKFLVKTLKDIYCSNFKTKLAAAILTKQHEILKQKLDYKNYGGAIFLGMEKPIVKAHGNSNATTFKNAFLQTIKCVEQKISLEISSNITNFKKQI